MNPLRVIKLYLRWRPEIEAAESAAKAAEAGNMKLFFQRISYIVEPIAYAAASGAFGALADYAHSAVAGESIDLKRMGTIAFAGAVFGLKVYFTSPRQKPAAPAEEKK